MNEVLQDVLAHWWRKGGKKKRSHWIVGTWSAKKLSAQGTWGLG